MEDDDEFGDLYTDVLKPFQSSSSAAAPPPAAPSHLDHPIDLNLVQSLSSLTVPAQKQPIQTLAGDGDEKEVNSAPKSRISETEGPKDLKFGGIGGGGDAGDDKDMKFDIEEGGDADNEPVIPGISVPGVSGGGGGSFLDSAKSLENVEILARVEKDSGGGGGGGEEDAWDSDESEDDLQIVLNDNNTRNMVMGDARGGASGGGGGEEDDDEDDDDEDPLVILGDMEPNVTIEEQEWGGDAAEGTDGERKEGGEAGKMGGAGSAVAPKIGYGGHGYHPFHSQFKYVRPGAAPMPGGTTAGPGGAAAQARPLVNMGAMAGRGRGDWRPQKGFHPGFGPWGSNAAGRGFGGGLDFTLPSHKTIFEVDIDGFEEKPWKYPGVDITDFFNFGLNEETWKDYCKQLEQRRLETTMQSRIRVYESGRTEQGYDPDLPPELAAAAGIQTVPPDTANFGKPEVAQSDSTKGSARVRQPLPTGRPIPVETGSGERLPSIDTRPPRIRDADAIIEIVCQGSSDDESSPGNGVEGVDKILTGDAVANHETTPMDTECVNGERAPDGSPHQTPSQSEASKRLLNKQEEELTDSINGNNSVPSSSPAVDRDARSSSMDHKDSRSERIELSAREDDDGGESKAERSSESSKARSGSQRGYQKSRDGLEDEVIQDRRRVRAASNRKQLDENEQNHHRRTRDVRHEVERNRMAMKGSRENSHPHGDIDPSWTRHSYVKTEDFDRRKEHDIADGSWRRRDDDPYSRKSRDEDSRKRDRSDDAGSRHRGKTRESEHLHSRKQSDDFGLRVHNDKDTGLRHKERDDHSRSGYEVADNYYSKRRKDEDYLRRDCADKDEILHGQREPISRVKRERDDRLEQQKRDVQQKIRENVDDRRSLRHKDELYLQRDGSERQREREELDKLKQTHEESLSVRERERQAALRSQRGLDDRGLSRAKDEYKASDKEHLVKDTTGHSKQQKRRDYVDEESSSHHRGHEAVNNERKSRPERSIARNDQAIDASDNQRAQEKRHKESKRKNKESGDITTLRSSRSKQEDQNGNINQTASKRNSESGNNKNENPVQLNTARKHKEGASSDEEQQDSRRGRSKLERWTSHKERDFTNSSKSSAPVKLQEIDKSANGGSSETNKPANSPVGNKQPVSEEKGSVDPEMKDVAQKPLGDRHLDTVEKLKKRSERFKLPMPNDKDASRFKLPMPNDKGASIIKKTDGEVLPAVKNEGPIDSEVKPERPARKRRWTSN